MTGRHRATKLSSPMTRQSAAFALSLRSFCLVVAGLWFTGVGDYAAAQSREPVQSLLEIRQNRVVVQQWDLSCGAAALATILKYQQGFSLLDLKRFVDERGYNGVGLGHLDVDDLVEYAPIIVPISVHAYRHFVVFRGILNDRVLLADPAFGNRKMSRSRFEKAWLALPEVGRVGFYVERTDSLIPPNRLHPTSD